MLKLICGDCISEMKYWEKECIHLTFTSPPYFNARKYSQYASYEDYLAIMSLVFSEVMRVTFTGRFLVVNVSPVITLREKRSKESVRHPIPFDLHNILTKIGWLFLEDIVWAKPESSVKNRIASFSQHRKPLAWKPNLVTEYILVYRKPCGKLLDWNIRKYKGDVLAASKVKDGYATTNLWQFSPVSSPHHPAIFPRTICDRIISYYSYVGDIVLDPFAGIGTVGLSARELDRDFILIEKELEYCKKAEERLWGKISVSKSSTAKM